MKILMIITVFFFATIATAQETISENSGDLSSLLLPISEEQQQRNCSIIGSVIDQSSREPIANALVSVLGTNLTSKTSEDGQFKIDSVAKGIYQLKAAAAGYEPQILNNVFINLEVKGPGFFTLQKEDQEPSLFIAVEKQPEPLAGNKPSPGYPELARKSGIEGTVWVKIWVDEQGNARKTVLLKSDAEILNQPSLETAMKWKFKPAMLKGQPVAVWVTVPFKFRLDKNSIEDQKKKK